jgi:hypothetical protein
MARLQRMGWRFWSSRCSLLFTPMSGYGLQREPVLAAPRIDFTWTLAGQCILPLLCFALQIPICKCSPNSTHYDVALLEHQSCTFLEKLSIRVVDCSAILPYACVMYVAGPKVALCAGPLIYALLKLQAEHHVKFTAIESSYIWR